MVIFHCYVNVYQRVISLVYHHNPRGMDISYEVYIHIIHDRKMHEGSPQHLSNIAWVTGCRGVFWSVRQTRQEIAQWEICSISTR